jgi:DNA-directed RNA polymerase specialized sigma24 family protein
VGEPSRDDLRATWQRMAQRNNWALVTDETEFLDRVAAQFSLIEKAETTQERVEMAIWRAYGTLLYRSLWHREEQAAQELWLAFVRLGLRGGRPRPEAEELAQEAITRVLDKLPNLREPESMLSWAIMIFRTVQRGPRKKMPNEQSLQAGDDTPEHDPPDATDLALEAEQRITSRALQAQLRAKLPNELERQTLLRIVILGDHPRDVAREFGLPLHRTRVAKTRALKRLRNDTEFIALLRDLADNPDLEPPRKGANDDDA